ncbi:GNAT family N-acetyltransferase [Streptomyces sp. NPDC056682]|uniref:GNAT family N-acetyltransferase n=1 Tax=Streptomyces sp. NPDC056682 TaxID=3345909 RepID=UPI0036BA0ACD
MPAAMSIEGELTRLVPVGEEDLDLLAGWFASSAFVEHWGGTPLARDEVAAKYVGRLRPQVESFLVLAGSGPVGYAQYSCTGGKDGGIDVLLIPEARGQGFGPDAAGALMAYLLQGRG